MHRAYARYGTAGGGPEAELVSRYGPLIDRCARRLSARSGHTVAAEDLWSAGAMGLIDAQRRFDGARDVKFETFAEHRIRGAMLDEMRRMDHLPRRLRADVEKVELARNKLAQSLGRDPGADELAEALGAEPADVAELLQLMAPPLPVEDDIAAAQLPEPDEALGKAQLTGALAKAIGTLPERLQVLLALYYDEELTYREIAKMLGVSEPRVCQLHSDAMKRLRGSLSGAAVSPPEE
ncbi:MAG: FliA/WhiG family RNA polymerase sigma factor [Anaeromyxobacter sp.]